MAGEGKVGWEATCGVLGAEESTLFYRAMSDAEMLRGAVLLRSGASLSERSEEKRIRLPQVDVEGGRNLG